MSHEQLLATLSRLEAAERAACGHESIDVNSVAGQCPAYQPYVFVLPAPGVRIVVASPIFPKKAHRGRKETGRAVLFT